MQTLNEKWYVTLKKKKTNETGIQLLSKKFG